MFHGKSPQEVSEKNVCFELLGSVQGTTWAMRHHLPGRGDPWATSVMGYAGYHHQTSKDLSDTRSKSCRLRSWTVVYRFSDLESLISTLESQISDLESRFLNFDSRILNLESRTSNLCSRISILESGISDPLSSAFWTFDWNVWILANNLKLQVSSSKLDAKGIEVRKSVTRNKFSYHPPAPFQLPTWVAIVFTVHLTGWSLEDNETHPSWHRGHRQHLSMVGMCWGFWRPFPMFFQFFLGIACLLSRQYPSVLKGELGTANPICGHWLAVNLFRSCCLLYPGQVLLAKFRIVMDRRGVHLQVLPVRLHDAVVKRKL